MATTFRDQFSGSGSAPTPVDPITGAGETVAYKAPCRLATTGNITLSGLQTVNGVTTAAGDRVLVRAQTDQKQNGIYIAAAGAWLRSRDFDSNRDITKGTRVTVTDGSTLAGREYQVTSALPIALGTDNITFAETLSSNAGGSAAAAAASASAAATSATNAGNSATAAAGSASTASTAATNAGNSATTASTAATNAGNSATAAGNSASAASTSATNASNSASAASIFATNAANSASAAAASASSIDTATLLSRANHTGTQLAATISDFASAVGALLSSAIGSTVQAYSAILTTIAGLTPSSGGVMVGNGTTWVVQTAATLRNSLGLGTGNSPQFTGIELGNASDTTLTRGAAGFMAVEGKRVPSPASQAAGDVLYRGTTEWDRLAKGTAGQVLTMNAGATAPEWKTPVNAASYESSQQTITNAGALTLAHGLGAQPKSYAAFLQCTTAENGYSIGDEVAVNPGLNAEGSGSRGLSMVADATNVNIRFGSQGTNTFMVIHKTSGASSGATNTNWRLVVRAWL